MVGSRGLYVSAVLALAAAAVPAAGQIGPGSFQRNPGLSAGATLQPLCPFPAVPFTPDRFSAVPADRMQIVAHYDGVGNSARLHIELRNPITNQCCTLSIALPASTRVFASEYVMNGFEPTGEFSISGAVPNGQVDGVAFGLYQHTAAGERFIIKSRAEQLAIGTPTFVGSWPMAFDELTWDAMLPAGLGGAGFNGFVARRQAQSTLSGAQLLPNGRHVVRTRSSPIMGDLTGDGCVDQADEQMLLAWMSGPPTASIGLCPTPVMTFTPDRFGALPPDRLQVVAVLDGNGQSDVIIELWNPATLQTCDLIITTPPAGAIFAQEYQLNGFEPTGTVQLLGLNPNGGLDGVALGMYFRDMNGDRCLMRTDDAATGPTFAGGWPVAWTEAQWDAALPATLGTPPGGFDAFVARRQAQSTLAGARFLPAIGVYTLQTCRQVPITPPDYNGDAVVDFLDLLILQGWMGQGCCP